MAAEAAVGRVDILILEMVMEVAVEDQEVLDI
jgi:hypothetical protein